MNATNLEQSKHLIELGVDESTADCYWWKDGDKILIGTMFNGDYDSYTDTPAWSLEALCNLFPCNENSPVFTLTRGTSHPKFSDEWIAKLDKSFYIGRAWEYWEYGKTSFEAVYKLVCWAKENGKI